MLKLMKNMYLFFALITSNVIFSAATFQKSAKEELEEMVTHARSLFPDKIEQNIRDELSRACNVLSDSSESLPELAQRLMANPEHEIIGRQLIDLQETFDRLKILMNIPHEVMIKFCHKQQGSGNFLYYSMDRTVYVLPCGTGQTPSMKLFCLIHELTHTQQHMQKGLVAMGGASIEQVCFDEHEADTCAARAINCPLCMQIIEDEFPRDAKRAEQGYITQTDITLYKQNKSMHDLCNAHKIDCLARQQLQILLPVVAESSTYYQRLMLWCSCYFQKDNAIERANLDWQIGTMADRLSTVRFL